MIMNHIIKKSQKIKKKNKKNKEIKNEKKEEEIINQEDEKETEIEENIEIKEFKDNILKNSINRFKIHKIKFKYRPQWLTKISNYP